MSTTRNWAKLKRRVKRAGAEPARDTGPAHGEVRLGYHQWRTRYPEEFPVTVTSLTER